MIRWSYVVPRLAVVGLLWAFFALSFDPLAERALERGASSALGARVDIGSFKTRFLPPSATLARVAAADPEEPMRNLFEFASAKFSLEGRPLLEKKLVVSAAALEGLAFGTPRKSSGAMPKLPPGPAAQALSRWTGEAKGALGDAGGAAKADLAADYKVDPESLASMKLARELEGRWGGAADSWKQKADAFDAAGKTKELEALLEKAKSGGPAERISAAAQLPKKISELRVGLKELSDGFKADLDKAKGDRAAVQRAKDDDLKSVAARLKLPVFDAERVTAYLLGPRVAPWVARAARLAKGASGGKEAAAPAPLARGAVVAFPKERSWPRLWLKSMTLSGAVDLGGALELRGQAKDLATEPALVPEPARLVLAGAHDSRSVSASLTSDHRKAAGKDLIELRVEGLPFAAQSFGEGPIAVAAGPGTAEVSVRMTLEEGRLGGEFSVRAVPSSLSARSEGAPAMAARALEEALKGLKRIELKGSLSGTAEEPRISLSSNLGTAAGDALKRVLGREAEERLKGVRAQVDKAVGEKLGPLQGKLDGQAKEALGKLGVGDDRLKSLQDRIARELKPAGLPIPGGFDKLFKR
ncbi:MAG: TIGR03545 family protein [Elusimicrobia bacterium]|nr:TIGR03545 family protein [Elusimicrobiota bacterium]